MGRRTEGPRLQLGRTYMKKQSRFANSQSLVYLRVDSGPPCFLSCLRNEYLSNFHGFATSHRRRTTRNSVKGSFGRRRGRQINNHLLGMEMFVSFHISSNCRRRTCLWIVTLRLNLTSILARRRSGTKIGGNEKVKIPTRVREHKQGTE